MKTISIDKLAAIVKKSREEKGFTKDELGKRCGINRIMIGRLERKDYIPSIIQLQAISNVLDFDITDLFVEKQKRNAFVALRSEAITDSEKDGVDKLFTMMLALRQQIRIRSSYENESSET